MLNSLYAATISSKPCPRFHPVSKSTDTTRDCEKSRTITDNVNRLLHSDIVHSIASSKFCTLYEHRIVRLLISAYDHLYVTNNI